MQSSVDVFAIECRRFKPHMRTQFRKQVSAENDLKRGKTGKPNNWLADYDLFGRVKT